MKEIKAKRRMLWIHWSLTAIIWLFVGPRTIPGIHFISSTWLVYGAILILATQLLISGRRFILGLFKDVPNLRKLPRVLISWAILLSVTSSIISLLGQISQGTNIGADLHFHSASFLISFYLLTEYLLDVADRYAKLKSLKELSLTPVMATTLKEAEESTPLFVRRTAQQLPALCIGVIVVTVLSFVAWFLLTGKIDKGFIQAATILTVCSPWMWLLAIPTSFRMALRAAVHKCALVGNAASIEVATQINAIVFGKRGTLTEGSPRVTDVVPMTNIDEEELLLWAASAEHDSHHPFGQAIVAEAKAQSIPLEPPEKFTEMTGRGVECVIDGQSVRLGKPAFFNKATIPAYLADRLEILAQEGKTPFICCRGNEYLGIIGVTEQVRREAAAAIENIRTLGLRTIMMTGDDRMMSETLAERLHIDKVIAEVLSEEKPKEINKLRREGFRIAMVGYIHEDNESFDESELGITLSRGKGRKLPSIDVIMLRDNLQHVVSFFEISGRAMRIARENRFFAYAYHAMTILFAAGCLVPLGYAPPTPIIGALLSGLALFMAMLNTRRMSRTA